MPNFIKIGQTVAEIWRFNGFQNGGHLVVSIVTPNLVKIDAVVSIT